MSGIVDVFQLFQKVFSRMPGGCRHRKTLGKSEFRILLLKAVACPREMFLTCFGVVMVITVCTPCITHDTGVALFLICLMNCFELCIAQMLI